MELLEHLPMADAFRVLHDMERIARSLVVFTTPVVWMAQGDLDGNPFQRHLCHLTPNNFSGYTHMVVPNPWGGYNLFYRGIFRERPDASLGTLQALIDDLITKVMVVP